MNQQPRALEQNNNWQVTLLPPRKQAIDCKWIYKTKYKSDGYVDKYKVRMVAEGFSQQYDIDYEETFALVAKMTVVRVLPVVAAMKQWLVTQMDVLNAFLRGDLEEEVYMALP